MTNEPIYLENGKVAGVLKDSTFSKTISKKHLLRKPLAICYDTTVLRKAESLGASKLEVKIRDNKEILTIALSEFYNESFHINRGYGEQLGVVMSKWRKKLPVEQLSLMEMNR